MENETPHYAALVVTLPANSRQHYRYSESVKKLFADQSAPGLWGIGRALQELAIPYPEFVASANAIISASVQEGFGFTMFEAPLAQKPYIARSTPTLELARPFFASGQLQQYHELRCPWKLPALAKKKDMLYRYYRAHIDDIAALYPPQCGARLQKQIAEMFEREWIDFSYLTHQLQRKVVTSANYEYMEALLKSNSELLAGISHSLTRHFVPPPYLALCNAYGTAQFARKIDAILTQNGNALQQPHSDIDSAIADQQCELEYTRMILNR